MRPLILILCLMLAQDEQRGANEMFGQDFQDYYKRYSRGQLTQDDPFAAAEQLSPLLPFGGPNPFTQLPQQQPEGPPPGFSVTPPTPPRRIPPIPDHASQEASNTQSPGLLTNVASLMGGGGTGLLGGGGGDMLGSGGQSAWGPMLMALGGGIASGSTQGWGAGIGAGLQGAAAISQKQRAMNQDQAQFDAKMKLLQAQQSQRQTTDDLREYQAAKNQGYAGSFMDYQTELRRAGAQNINLGPTGIDYGTPPGGMTWARDQNNAIVTEPVPDRPDVMRPVAVHIQGSEADIKRQAAEEKAKTREGLLASQSDIVNDDIDKVLTQIESAKGPVTGFTGGMVAKMPGSEAYDVGERLRSIKANIAFDRITQMRETSPTGGALGNVTDQDMKKLEAAYGSLEQSQSKNQLVSNLQRFKRVYNEVVHGNMNATPWAKPKTTGKTKSGIGWSLEQ